MKKKSILVIGAGRFGTHFMKKMSSLGHEVLAVDKSEARIDKVVSFVTGTLIGDSTDYEFIKSLDVPSFDVCMVTIGDDFQSSLETTSLLKEAGAKYVVARASRGVQEKFLLRNGADSVVYPEKQVAEWAAIRYSSSDICDYIEVSEDYAIFELEVPAEWVGKTVQALQIRPKMHLNILAIKRDGVTNVEVKADSVFKKGDTFLVLGKDANLKKYLHVKY